MRTLDDPNGPLFAVSAASVGENSLPELLRNRELIMDRIISDPMHGPA
jgi:hypothetical protein